MIGACDPKAAKSRLAGFFSDTYWLLMSSTKLTPPKSASQLRSAVTGLLPMAMLAHSITLSHFW